MLSGSQRGASSGGAPRAPIPGVGGDERQQTPRHRRSEAADFEIARPGREDIILPLFEVTKFHEKRSNSLGSINFGPTFCRRNGYARNS